MRGQQGPRCTREVTSWPARVQSVMFESTQLRTQAILQICFNKEQSLRNLENQLTQSHITLSQVPKGGFSRKGKDNQHGLGIQPNILKFYQVLHCHFLPQPCRGANALGQPATLPPAGGALPRGTALAFWSFLESQVCLSRWVRCGVKSFNFFRASVSSSTTKTQEMTSPSVLRTKWVRCAQYPAHTKC